MLLSCARSQPPASPYDLLITGGSVIDGNGTPGVSADLAIQDGKIAAVGSLAGAAAARRIDATGLIVAPGFIDMHNHSDYTILAEPRSESMIRQGVTTMVLGESRSAGPVKPGVNDDWRARSDGAAVDWTTLGGYFEKLERQHMATNIASYVGEEQVWTYVKGYGQSPATPGEIEAMKKLVAQAMEEGAMGLSTSLLQPPSSLATTENLIELAKVAKQYRGIYSSHIRDEGERVFESIDEAIRVGKGANIPVDIIHMKIAHKNLWGRVNEIVGMVQKARDAGYDIQANVYPYTAGQNNLSSIVPPWAHDGGRDKMIERLRDPAARRRMREEVLNGIPGWYNHYLATGDGWGGMLLVSLQHERNKPFQGRRMSDLIQARGGNPADVLFDVLIEENGSVPTVFFHHSEPDMQLVMKQPWTSIGSDGSAVNPEGPTGRSHPHPRYYGTFPRVLGRYVRELNVLPLPEAVKKMTSMNADKIGIKDRGRLERGKAADVTIFDADRVIDRATFENPHQFPVGIKYVIVNGVVTIDDEKHTGALAGRVLYGPGRKSSKNADSAPPQSETAAETRTRPATASTPSPLSTWLDPETAHKIMAARAEFDAVELAIMSELERRMGSYRKVFSITREQYASHLGGSEIAIPRSDAWQHEQYLRVAYARHILTPPFEAARGDLQQKTLAALRSFFDNELRAGRISKADYRRYTVEIRRGEFPGFRPRKWSGPPIYEFRGATVSPEYQKVLQEVRRLWQAQGRKTSAVVWTKTSREFYKTLVPPRPARLQTP